MSVDADTVVFDFDGALELVKRLRQLADACEAAYQERVRNLESAMKAWHGPSRERFQDQMIAEQRVAAMAFEALRVEANYWLAAWGQAVAAVHELAQQGDQPSVPDLESGSAAPSGMGGRIR